MKLFILIVALFALSSALSENIKAITGCWILAIHDNSRSKVLSNHYCRPLIIWLNPFPRKLKFKI